VIEDVPPTDEYSVTTGFASQLREFKLMFMKNVRYSVRKKGLLLLAVS